MTARDYALRELDSKLLPNWRTGQVRRGPRGLAPNDPRDRGLAEHIIAGVTKNVLLLQHLVGHYSGRSLKSVDPVVQKIVAIGLYQLRFLQRIPSSAAVDEAVEQAKRFGHASTSGFVNAVLRNATREPNPPLPPRTDAMDYAQVVLSHPPWLFQRLVDLVGVHDALLICEHNNREPPTIARLLPGRDAAELIVEGVTAQAHEQPGLYVVQGAKQAILAAWAQDGLAQVQDPTSARVVDQLDLHPGQVALDRCCGLGTKTIQLRERVADTGRVIGIDPNTHRIGGLRTLLARRQFQNVDVHEAAMLRDRPNLPAIYDRILVDAPCSNSGVLARRPEARYAQSAQANESLIRLQDQILDDSAPHVAPMGLLLYSTCSIWPDENQARIAAFLNRHPDFQLVRQATTLPSLVDDPCTYRDGGYYALVRRHMHPGRNLT